MNIITNPNKAEACTFFNDASFPSATRVMNYIAAALTERDSDFNDQKANGVSWKVTVIVEKVGQ